LFWEGNQSYEIFSAVLGAINQGDRLQLVIGGPGLGKSVLCRKLYNSLRSHKTRYNALCPPSPHIDLEDLLSDSKCQRAGHLPTIVLIDEAQALSGKALEYLADTLQDAPANQTIIQVILFAQPVLSARLAKRSFEALQQQVCQTYELNPLTESLTHDYLYSRVVEAGGNPAMLLGPGMLAELHKSSGGVPRLINSLMRKALILAYEESSTTLSSLHVRKAMSTLAVAVP
jgi:MSHA biogenesis protein MshM